MKRNIFSAIAILIISNAFCEGVKFSYSGSGSYNLVERTDLRRYDNGKYTGLVSKEVRSFISPYEKAENNGDRYYSGSFYILEQTKHAMRNAAAGFNDSIASEFKITKDNRLIMIVDNGYPSFRSFPAFSQNKINPGDSWQAKAERAADPLNKGIVTKMPIYVQYTYIGDEQRNGEDVYVIKAKWATRYGGTFHIDWGGDSELKSAQGSHDALMHISKRTGAALVINDTVDETFTYIDGTQVQFKGKITLFTEYPPAVDRSRIIPALQRTAIISEKEAELLANKLPEKAAEQNPKTQKSDFPISKEKAVSITDYKSSKNSTQNNNLSSEEDNESLQNNLNKQETSALDKKTATAFAKKIKPEENNIKKDFTDSAIQNNSGKTDKLKQKDNFIAQNSSSEKSINNQSPLKKEKNGRLNESSIDENVNNKKKNIKKDFTDSAIQNNSGKTDKLKQKDNFIAQNSSSEKSISVENTSAGLKLTISNLQFKADSSEFLPGENSRLDKIAEVLKEAPDSQFLVEGHTASTGYEAGEMKLSIERAHAVAAALSARGIPAGKFICKGSGGKKPIADNSTPKGKAANRRVEITVLE